MEPFLNYDVILTTFKIVADEWNSPNDPLHKLRFHRLVLDEAHVIRNETMRQSRAVCELDAERRWAVTGTPLHNNLRDFATLFKFLRYSPLDTKEGFYARILASQSGESTGMENLQSALKDVCLRRTKSHIASYLPGREERVVHLTFTASEQELYEKEKAGLINLRRKGKKAGPAETLKLLCRLRLICDHGEDLLRNGRGTVSMKIECIVCGQSSKPGTDEAIQYQSAGCPHRSLCGQCTEVMAGVMDECQQCENTDVSSAPGPFKAQNISETYRGPSTKVLFLIQEIRREYKLDSISPKQ